jgi:hypothetical protein
MEPYEEPGLPAGWETDTPPGDTFVRDYLLATADWSAAVADRAGQRFERDEHVALHDAGSPIEQLNVTLVLHPAAFGDPAAFVDRLQRWYGDASGGGFALFSPWPTPDLRPYGLKLDGHPPLMLRAAGGEPRPAPENLRIEAVQDADGLADFTRAAALGFGIDPGPDPLLPLAAIDVPDFQMFVGYADGEPVACSAGRVAERLQHVEIVATRQDWRGRGYGEALTWSATMLDPSKPAGLIASDAGRPVYERMGYIALTRLTSWSSPRST